MKDDKTDEWFKKGIRKNIKNKIIRKENLLINTVFFYMKRKTENI